jgi:hypothetical protein
MATNPLPCVCPSCQQSLGVTRLACGNCGTAVEGQFELPVLVRLTAEEQAFALSFLESGGSLKELARRYGVSYPTVRNRLDALIEKITHLQPKTEEQKEGERS